MLQTIDDARAQVSCDLLDYLGSEIPANCIAAQRQRQPGILQPPGPEIGPEMQTGVTIGELSFMDEQSDVHIAPMHCLLDLIERNYLRNAIRLIQLQRQIRRGELSRDGYSASPQRIP